MAENVHQNLESMLPELEELERMGVFSSDEIRYAVFRTPFACFIICSFRQGQLQNIQPQITGVNLLLTRYEVPQLVNLKLTVYKF